MPEIRLCDDGTMDTVVEWYCDTCEEWHEIRYDMETAAPYRDELTGALGMDTFVDGVVSLDIECEEPCELGS